MKILQFFLSFFFPVYCCVCKQEGKRVCDRCIKEFLKHSFTVSQCPICQKETSLYEVCPQCKHKTFLDALFVVSSYDKNMHLQLLIKKLKYSYAYDIAQVLAILMKDFLNHSSFPFSKYRVTYVPLHLLRYMKRGFNQSYLIAQSIKTPQRLLRRVKNTPQQVKLSKIYRVKNMKNAFVAYGSIPQKILIIDDVASSLATLNACAKALKQNGAKEVVACVLARNNLQ